MYAESANLKLSPRSKEEIHMAKSKYIMHQCAYCRRESKMEFVGGQPTESTNAAEPVKIWYRCCRCKHSALLTIAPAVLTKKNQSIAFDRDLCVPYSKDKTFAVGDHIFHTELDDVGKVVRKEKMSNGIHSIVVSFEKLGERKLLESIPSETEEVVENEAV
jgi:hypothetical protein